MNLQGTYTALITPFDQNGQLDVQGLRFLIRRQIEGGIDGITALGATAETATLSKDEQREIMRICESEIAGKIPLMVGTGSNSTAQTIENTLVAQETGADSVLIVTPYYNKPTQEGLYLHFKAIAESADIPIVVYNVPYRTGVNLHPDTLKRLMELPSVIGIKDASGNIQQTSDTIELIQNMRPSFTLLTGDDSAILPSMALGGSGVISVVSNLVPEMIKKLVHAARIEDYIQARQLHFALAPLFKAAFLETNPIPIKAAMKLCRLPAGECRLPLCRLSDESLVKIQDAIHNLSNEEAQHVFN